jgi:hypothetical protein
MRCAVQGTSSLHTLRRYCRDRIRSAGTLGSSSALRSLASITAADGGADSSRNWRWSSRRRPLAVGRTHAMERHRVSDVFCFELRRCRRQRGFGRLHRLGRLWDSRGRDCGLFGNHSRHGSRICDELRCRTGIPGSEAPQQEHTKREACRCKLLTSHAACSTAVAHLVQPVRPAQRLAERSVVRREAAKHFSQATKCVCVSKPLRYARRFACEDESNDHTVKRLTISMLLRCRVAREST